MKRSESYALRDVGGKLLLVPLGTQILNTNGLVVLNDTGHYLWELLATDCSMGDLTAALVERFNIDVTQANDDVQSFIEAITELGMVEK